jgi:hypothetical protein
LATKRRRETYRIKRAKSKIPKKLGTITATAIRVDEPPGVDNTVGVVVSGGRDMMWYLGFSCEEWVYGKRYIRSR